MEMIVFACAVALVGCIVVGLTGLIGASTEMGTASGKVVPEGELFDFASDAERAWSEARPERESRPSREVIGRPIAGLAA